MYPLLKNIHITCVVISIAGFVVRGVLVQYGAAVMHRRWMRVIPHLNDTVLLASAVAMAMQSGQYPFAAGWLTAKLAGLVAYVGLGAIALRGRDATVRRAAFVAAVLVYGWIVSAAILRHPAGAFAVAA